MLGGSRKDESLALNSTNVFAALGSLRKKKKSSASEKEQQGSSKTSSKQKDPEKEIFWAPAPLTAKSWADIDDDDDDDYYATTAPAVSSWGPSADPNQGKEVLELSESEEEGLDEVDDDVEEEHENEHEPEAPTAVEVIITKLPEASLGHKESERQLSKKELKKKGLEELDAVLAELGYTKQGTGGQDDSNDAGAVQGVKTENNEVEKKENAPGESKSSKKKKKKEKTLKEAKGSKDQPRGADVENGIHEAAETQKSDDIPAIDVKSHLKKAMSTKKKKSSKETDAVARAAASEAAARSAKLAAAKKKEKNHYNQQPVR